MTARPPLFPLVCAHTFRERFGLSSILRDRTCAMASDWPWVQDDTWRSVNDAGRGFDAGQDTEIVLRFFLREARR